MKGSIGNLCLPEIKAKMESILYSFDFEGVEGKIKTTSLVEIFGGYSAHGFQKAGFNLHSLLDVLNLKKS